MNTRMKPSVRVKQKTTVVKYVVAGTLIFTLLGVGAFLYFNIGQSEDAAAKKRGPKTVEQAPTRALLDLSHLSSDEMSLLTDRDYVRDTVQKDYTSVKWDLNNRLSHLTLEVSNTEYEYSLELFDQNGFRVLYFQNLTDEKVFVDKLELRPNHEYHYLVRNSAGELYAGNLKFE